jgi:ATP/maltotriose-dependent transcriptional regulator MalT
MQLGAPHLLLEAHHTAWFTHLLLANFAEARRHIERGLGLFDAASTREVGVLSSIFPEVHCLCSLAVLESLCGSPDRARDASHRGIALATAKRHGFSVGAALLLGSFAAAVLDDIVWYRECASRALAVAQNQQMQWIEGVALVASGYAAARGGDAAAGLANIESGREILRAIGAVMLSSYHLTLKAEVLMKLGRLEEARVALASANELETTTGEIVLRPLRLCTLAELERLAGDRELAASHLRAAIEDSHVRGSRTLELRAMAALTNLG